LDDLEQAVGATHEASPKEAEHHERTVIVLLLTARCQEPRPAPDSTLSGPLLQYALIERREPINQPDNGRREIMQHSVCLSTTTTPASYPSRLAHFVRTWWQRRAHQRRINATVRILRALDARTLKDIGLHRSGIESAVAGQCSCRRINLALE
jgi:uncharacterized protein YjiS (DUF1127 family)